jgi:molybdenum-dependent DNA-binding transcriptional regulator ModE
VKTRVMLRLEERDPSGRDIDQILIDAVEEAGCLVAAARRVGISHGCFSNWLRMRDLEIRSSSRLVRKTEGPVDARR